MTCSQVMDSQRDRVEPAACCSSRYPVIWRDICFPNLPYFSQALTALRLAVSHNQLTNFPTRLIECKRLRYLNARYNALKELSPSVCYRSHPHCLL